MKYTTKLSTLFACSIFSFNTYAGEIDANNITTFTSGSVISSSEVNTSVSEAVTQINDNDSRIDALEQAISALEVQAQFFAQHIIHFDGAVPFPTANETSNNLTRDFTTTNPELKNPLIGTWLGTFAGSTKIVFTAGLYIQCDGANSTTGKCPSTSSIEIGTYFYNGSFNITSHIINGPGGFDDPGGEQHLSTPVGVSVTGDLLTLTVPTPNSSVDIQFIKIQ